MEPLKYAEVAAAASVSWQTGKACIFGTTSLVSHCLRKGENIAFVLKDVGVLLIEGTSVEMKFYYDFLERISGKENLEKVVFKVRVWFLHGPCAACTWLTGTWPAARAAQVLRCCQLSRPWAPPALSSASAVTRTSHILPVPALQVPWLLDMVVSRVAAVASLTSSGRVIVFPR